MFDVIDATQLTVKPRNFTFCQVERTKSLIATNKNNKPRRFCLFYPSNIRASLVYDPLKLLTHNIMPQRRRHAEMAALLVVLLLHATSCVSAANHWFALLSKTQRHGRYFYELNNLPVQHQALSSKLTSTSSLLPSSLPSGPLSTSPTTIALCPRGGALLDDTDDEDGSDTDDDTHDFLMDDIDFDDNDDEFREADFAEDNTLERMVDAFQKTPPLTKAYLTCSFVATLYGYVCNKNQFPSWLSLEWKPVLTKLQLWRPFTAFFNFGPFGLGYLMTAHFVWTYMSTLERLSHKAPYDFWIMIVFGQLCMVCGYPLMKLSPRFLGHNLSTFLVYIWARYHEGLEVNLFELFNTRAELLPWFFLAQTALLEGEPPVLDFLGIVFGHVYHYCKTVGLLRAPPALRQWYTNSDNPWAQSIRKQYQQIASDFEMV